MIAREIEAKEMVGREFEVKGEWRIGTCKMKKGDILRVVDWGLDSVDYYLTFENERLKGWHFQTALWAFRKRTAPIEKEGWPC